MGQGKQMPSWKKGCETEVGGVSGSVSSLLWGQLLPAGPGRGGGAGRSQRPQCRVHQESCVVTGQVQRDAFCNRSKAPRYLFVVKCRFGYWTIPKLAQPVSSFLRRPSRRACCPINLV